MHTGWGTEYSRGREVTSLFARAAGSWSSAPQRALVLVRAWPCRWLKRDPRAIHSSQHSVGHCRQDHRRAEIDATEHQHHAFGLLDK